MSAHFFEFNREHESPGLILIPGTRAVAQAIEDLFTAREHWPSDRIRNQLLWPSDLYKHF